jgi:hypothetical protein
MIRTLLGIALISLGTEIFVTVGRDYIGLYDHVPSIPCFGFSCNISEEASKALPSFGGEPLPSIFISRLCHEKRKGILKISFLAFDRATRLK